MIRDGSDILTTSAPEIIISTAEEFVTRLRPSSVDWGSLTNRDTTWVFRGHGNAEWPLLPSAQRADCFLKNDQRASDYVQSIFSARKVSNKPALISPELAAQHLVEAMIILQFNDLFDDLGFPRLVSSANRIKPRIASAILGYEGFEWTPSVAHGVAQHHGIPTRLLDWSRDPLVSAYFAARDAIRLQLHQEDDRYLAVWALDSWAIPMFRGLARTFEIDNIHSTFIHAQRGIFTWVDGDAYFEEKNTWMALDKAVLLDLEIENHAGHDDLLPSKWKDFEGIGADMVIRKYKLPTREAKTLVAILQRERRSLAYLMPTLDNIAQSVKEDW